MKKSFLLIICVMFLCSCSFLSYQGKTATQKPIPLKDGGPHEGVWKTYDMTVSYTYQRNQNNLQLSGTVQLNNSIANNFSSVDHFRFKVHLTDAQGKISDSWLLADSGHGVKIEKWQFRRNLTMPAGAEAMVFSYDGRAAEAIDDMTTWDFWMTP